MKNDGTGIVYIKIVEDEEVLRIEVKDNGCGIPIENMEKIYEQGFSTKEEHRGHGMYIVKKIITDLDGKINLSVDNGVFWHITIPIIRGNKID